MVEAAALREQIVTAALALGERTSWERVTLSGIADELGITLEQIRVHFPHKDDIAEAWFDRADSAMLRYAATADFRAQSDELRVYGVIMVWLDALAPHRRVTGEMLLYKFEPGHLHLQALGIMRVSRTVQWFREAARLHATKLRRVLEEAGLTSVYLLVFARWLNDHSEDSAATRALLRRLLRAGAPLMGTTATAPEPYQAKPDDGGAR